MAAKSRALLRAEQTIASQRAEIEALKAQHRDALNIQHKQAEELDGQRQRQIRNISNRLSIFQSPELEQFLQIVRGPVHEGDLESKEARKSLVEGGLVCPAAGGFTILTPEGARIAHQLGKLRERRTYASTSYGDAAAQNPGSVVGTY